MISGKDVNFNDETHVLSINGEKHAVGDPGEIDALDERVTSIEGVIDNRVEFFKSTTSDVTQIIEIGVIEENRTYAFACGFNTNYVLELIAISANGANVAHKPIANSNINSISALSFDATTGIITITVANNPFGYGRMTRLS